mmetsp:Transcript_25721/g.45137  ORF Transcript_25721/g.45137 Transcript_25721/m.45137 type:complete len:245 (+) Transcript_25721:2401-3135(+)
MIDRYETLSLADLLFLAKVSEQSERYEDCADYIEVLAKRETRELSYEERSLIGAAFKNIVSNKRSAWQVLTYLREKYKHEGEREKSRHARRSRKALVTEIEQVSSRILQLIENDLLPKTTSSEAIAFYMKLQGDYLRYIAEVTSASQRQQAVEKATEAYIKAYDYALKELVANHPIRLGLILNYSVFIYDILGQSSRAQAMAKAALEEAISGLDNVAEESYKDSTLVISLLRDNLQQWTNDIED